MKYGVHSSGLHPGPLTAAAAIGLLVCLFAPSAHGWVCSRVLDAQENETGPALSWYTRDLTYTLHTAGTVQLDDDTVFRIIRQSFWVWEGGPERDGVEACGSAGGRSDIRFENTPEFSAIDRLGYNYVDPNDNENLFIFRDDGWSHQSQRGVTIALTTTSYRALTGELLDADIEFNTADFAFGTSGATNAMDLMNTAVHEIGHFIGLGHSDVVGSTMSVSANKGDVDKRDLACDDRNAFVFKYPMDEANGYCVGDVDASCGKCAPPEELEARPTVTVVGNDDGEGCQSAGAPALLLWLVGLLVVGIRRSRHSV